MSVNLKEKQKQYENSPTTSFRMCKKDFYGFEIAAEKLQTTRSKIIQHLIKEFLKDPNKFRF